MLAWFLMLLERESFVSWKFSDCLKVKKLVLGGVLLKLISFCETLLRVGVPNRGRGRHSMLSPRTCDVEGSLNDVTNNPQSIE